eukprot:scaffold86386_cov75-Phaeocystis_antarctica.AAC.8
MRRQHAQGLGGFDVRQRASAERDAIRHLGPCGVAGGHGEQVGGRAACCGWYGPVPTDDEQARHQQEHGCHARVL